MNYTSPSLVSYKQSTDHWVDAESSSLQGHTSIFSYIKHDQNSHKLMRFCLYRHIQTRGEWLLNQTIEMFLEMPVMTNNVKEVSGLP